MNMGKQITDNERAANFNKLLLEVQKNTHNNLHGGGLSIIAEFFKFRVLKDAFDGVNEIHSTFGEMDSNLKSVRDKLSDQLFAKIEENEVDGDVLVKLLKKQL